jgi:hypothetical protein
MMSRSTEASQSSPHLPLSGLASPRLVFNRTHRVAPWPQLVFCVLFFLMTSSVDQSSALLGFLVPPFVRVLSAQGGGVASVPSDTLCCQEIKTNKPLRTHNLGNPQACARARLGARGSPGSRPGPPDLPGVSPILDESPRRP